MAKKKTKTIFRQVDKLFGMCRNFGKSKKGSESHLISTGSTYSTYREACMRWAEDLAQRRGTKKFQIISVKPREIKNFLERIAAVYRPETVHQYAAALQKLEHMMNEKYCKNRKVDWKIDKFEKPKRAREDITVQRGPAYLPQEADQLISKITEINKQTADALTFIQATGCRAESIFGRLKKTGGKVVVDGKTVKEQKTTRDFSKAVTADRIDLVKGTVTLCEKGGRWRTIKYDKRYQGFMERFGSIFAGLKQQTVYSQIKKVTKEIGIEGRGLHGMRKTFAILRHKEYTDRVRELVQKREWSTLVGEFPVSVQKARAICTNQGDERTEKDIDSLARLKLTKDLGHNRIEVTFRYVSKK